MVWYAAIVAASMFMVLHTFCRNILRVVLQADAKQKLDVAGMLDDNGIHCGLDFLQDGILVQDLTGQAASTFFPYALFLQSENPFFRQQERKSLVCLQPGAHSSARIVWNDQPLDEKEMHSILASLPFGVNDLQDTAKPRV